MAKQEREQMLQDKLDGIEKERIDAKDQLDRERLMRVSSEVINTVTSPEFVENMRKMRISADEGGGLEVASKLLSIDGLREAGVNIPTDFRLTSRVFEDQAAAFKFELKSDPLIAPGGMEPLRWGGCAGAGGTGVGTGFCGCAGFSV